MKYLVCALGLLAAASQPLPSSHGQPPKGVVVEPRFEHDARFIRVGNTTHGVRYKTASGEAWLLALDKWEKIADDGKLPAGDYEVFLTAGDNDFSAFRFDHKTGATWQLVGQKWAKVASSDASK